MIHRESISCHLFLAILIVISTAPFARRLLAQDKPPLTVPQAQTEVQRATDKLKEAQQVFDQAVDKYFGPNGPKEGQDYYNEYHGAVLDAQRATDRAMANAIKSREKAMALLLSSQDKAAIKDALEQLMADAEVVQAKIAEEETAEGVLHDKIEDWLKQMDKQLDTKVMEGVERAEHNLAWAKKDLEDALERDDKHERLAKEELKKHKPPVSPKPPVTPRPPPAIDPKLIGTWECISIKQANAFVTGGGTGFRVTFKRDGTEIVDYSKMKPFESRGDTTAYSGTAVARISTESDTATIDKIEKADVTMMTNAAGRTFGGKLPGLGVGGLGTTRDNNKYTVTEDTLEYQTSAARDQHANCTVKLKRVDLRKEAAEKEEK